MNKNIILLRVIPLIIVLLISSSQFVLSQSITQNQLKFPDLTGPYFGQKPPGKTAEIFAPGIISTNLNEGNICFSPDGREFYYCFMTPEGPFRETLLFHSKMKNSIWTEPKEPPFYPSRKIYYQFMTPDGKKLFFNGSWQEEKTQKRPASGIFYIEKKNGDWTGPVEIDFGKNSPFPGGAYPSIAANGNLYFFSSVKKGDVRSSADLYRSEFKNGKYLSPVKLSIAVNTTEFHECHPYISPDEGYIIFDSSQKEKSFGGDDLFISFRDQNGKWMKARNLSNKVNSKYDDRRPFVTFDGKYFFFVSFRTGLPQLPEKKIKLTDINNLINGPKNGMSDFYWVDTKVIDELKPDHLK